MIDFLQTTVGVVTDASIYLLIGLAWNLVFNACGYLNLAMGEFFILGAMLSYKLEASWGVTSPWLAGLLTIAAVGAAGFIAERAILRPLRDWGLPPLVVTIGIALVLLQLAKALSSALAIRPSLFISGGIAPAGVHVSYQELMVWASAVVVGAAFVLFFTCTDRGRVMRACADNRRGAENLGVRVSDYATTAFTVSVMLAALAAVEITPIQSVAYNSGDIIALKAFLAVSVLGIGRNGGAVGGAVLVAALEDYLARYVNPVTADTVLLITFIVILSSYAVRSEGERLLPGWLRLRRQRPESGRSAGMAG